MQPHEYYLEHVKKILEQSKGDLTESLTIVAEIVSVISINAELSNGYDVNETIDNISMAAKSMAMNVKTENRLGAKKH